MNINDILKISKLCVMRLTENKKKINKLSIVVWSCCSKTCLCDINCFTISICVSVSQFDDGTD